MLNPATASYAITDAYLLAASINSDGTPTGNPPQGDYPAAFSQSIDDYAQEGLVPGAVNTGGDASIIENFMRNIDGTAAGVQAFALALASYWATVAVTPGAPAHGGTAVVSVVNDAMAHVADFAAAISASITSSEQTPYFQHLIANIETMAVKKIIWTVTEMMPTVPPAPVPWPEGIQ